AQMPATEGEVTARIAGVAAQGFAPVVFGVTRRVAILLKMKSGEVKFVIARDVSGCWRFRGGSRNAGRRRELRRVGNQFGAFTGEDAESEIHFASFRTDHAFKEKRAIGSDVLGPLADDFSHLLQTHHRVVLDGS